MTGAQGRSRTARNSAALLVKWAISPYGAVAFASILFLFAWTLPPSVYSLGLQEPDYLWLDGPSFLLFASCAAAFLLGVHFIAGKRSFMGRNPIPTHVSVVPYILPPLICSLAFGLVGILIILRQEPQILTALLSGAGDNIKSDLIDVALPQGIAAAGSAMLAVLYWGVNNYSYVPNGRSKRVVRYFLIAYVVILFTIALVKVSRNDLMTVIAGTITIRIGNGLRQARADMQEIKLVAKALVGMVLLFSMLSLLRGTSTNELLGNFFGYTIAGYNRMAAIVHHQIPYLDAGNGDHLFGGILQNRTVNSLYPFQAIYNLPDQLDVWLSDFTAVLGAGLASQYTFASCFGFIFIDAGWWTPVVIFVCGLFSGYVWRRFQQGYWPGVLLYPVVLFTILMWFGTNMLISMNTIIFLLTTLALLLYQKCFMLLVVATADVRNMAQQSHDVASSSSR